VNTDLLQGLGSRVGVADVRYRLADISTNATHCSRSHFAKWLTHTCSRKGTFGEVFGPSCLYPALPHPTPTPHASPSLPYTTPTPAHTATPSSRPLFNGILLQVRFDPEAGNYLVTSSFDRLSKVWSTKDFKLLRSVSASVYHISSAPGPRDKVSIRLHYHLSLTCWAIRDLTLLQWFAFFFHPSQHPDVIG